MTNKKEILKVDESLTSSFKKIKSIANKLEFEINGKEFKLNKNHIKEIEWDKFQYKGLYLFEIKNTTSYTSFDDWISDFREKWEDKRYVKCFTPNIRKKRLHKHREKPLSEWIPLYIGKSQKPKGRVHEHIFKELNKTTFALKLNARENLKDEIFRVSTIELDLENYSELMSLIESTLRDKYSPIIGRQ